MSIFDNANTTVTRKSFGSKVDKTFKREGVVPLKDRKKPEVVTESTNFEEQNKKLEHSRMDNLISDRNYSISLQEGYGKLKDTLIKDILSEICVEAMLVDDNMVENNLKNIVSIVEEKVDEIGGYDGIQKIAESTNNQLLKNMVLLCEATCKQVGKRKLQENRETRTLDFSLSREELDEFDYRKKDLGVDRIATVVQDKVLKVVQDEQKMNTERQELMSEMEMKLQDANAPVQEAMDFIFNRDKIEETTLFDSLMRSHYKQVLESNSSVIFESFDYEQENPEVVFEDQEFQMSDVSLITEGEDCDEEEMEYKDELMDEFIEDDMLGESVVTLSTKKIRKALLENMVKGDDYVVNILKNELAIREPYSPYVQEALGEVIKGLLDDTTGEDTILESMNKVVEGLNQKINGIKIKFEAIKCKECLRSFQQDFDKIISESLAVEDIPNKCINITESLMNLPSIDEVYSILESRMASVSEGGKECEGLEDLDKLDKKQKTEAKVEEGCEGKKVEEEVIICPDCGKAECTCLDTIEEGFAEFKNDAIEKLRVYLYEKNYKDMAKRDFKGKVRPRLTKMVGKIKDPKQIDRLYADLNMGIKQLEIAKKNNPEYAESITDHIDWLKTDYRKLLNERRKELKKIVKESYYQDLGDNEVITEGKVKDGVQKVINLMDNILTGIDAGTMIVSEIPPLQRGIIRLFMKLPMSKHDVMLLNNARRLQIDRINRIEDIAKIKMLEKHKKFLEGEFKNKLDEKLEYIKSVENKGKEKVKESLLVKIDECCNTLDLIIETHEIAYNNVYESVMYNINDNLTLVPYLQAKDSELSNLELIYKTKLVCESLKEAVRNVHSYDDLDVLNKAIELNIQSLTESIAALEQMDSMKYKAKVFYSGKSYLEKLQGFLRNHNIEHDGEPVVIESTSVFNTTDDVERLFNRVKEYCILEETNDTTMELVMAEAIVEYTILEAFNTLKLENYDKNKVRNIARKNINK